MNKLNWALALTLVLGVVSCGKSGSVDALKSGYFVAEGDLSKVHYPLVVIKVGNNKSSLYQVSQVISGGFGAGTSASNTEDEESLGTLGTGIGGGKTYGGIATKAGQNIRMRAYLTEGFVARPSDLNSPKTKVLQDYTMKSVTKDEAIKTLRTLVKRARGPAPVYSAEQEKACKEAFEMTCNLLVP